MATQLRPYPGSLISVTNKGEVCLFDPTASERSGLDSIGTYIILRNMPLKNRTNSRNNTGCFLSDRILNTPRLYLFFQQKNGPKRIVVLHNLFSYPRGRYPLFTALKMGFVQTVHYFVNSECMRTAQDLASICKQVVLFQKVRMQYVVFS